MPIRADALVVMAKAPIPGAVKTRLVPFLSIDQAAKLARALLIDQLDHLKAISTADLYLAFTPQESKPLMRELAPASFELFPQINGDLGARMENVFATLFARGHKNIILIGADLLPVPLRYFTQAFTYLDGKKSPFHPPLAKHVLSRVEGGARGGFVGPQQRAVLGPSQDGGYYLVGLNQDQPALFEQMTWSHDQVLAQTIAKLASLRIPTEQLPGWFDVDTVEDLQRVVLFKKLHPSEMKNTLEILARLPIRPQVGDNLES